MNTQEVRQIYNEKIKNQPSGSYEKERWFLNEISKAAYEMTLNCVKKYFLDDLGDFINFLEVGSGAGTWTKLFVKKQPAANFDLVDISGEMIKQAKENLGSGSNIGYFETDFLEFDVGKKYDVFFSCRALEYFPDKNEFIKKVSLLLAPGGKGLIVTKAPKYLRNKILGRQISRLHQWQISWRSLRESLFGYGLVGAEFYPAAMYLPLFKSAAVNRFVYGLFGGKRLNFLTNLFSESYAVKFTKKAPATPRKAPGVFPK